MFLPADHPLIRWDGRHARANGQVTFGWPLVTGSLRFQGSAIRLLLNAEGCGAKVWLDGQRHETLSFSAQGLSSGEHELVWARSGQANHHVLHCEGIELDGTPLPPAARASARMLFVGDSLTVGYGNACPGNCQDREEDVEAHTDSFLAFPALYCRAMGLQPEVVAVSGRGACKNYGDTPPSQDPLGLYLDRCYPTSDAPLWTEDLAEAQGFPEVGHIFLLLGANDFSTLPHPRADAFLSAYTDICQRLRNRHPQAELLCSAPLGEPQYNHVLAAFRDLPTTLQARWIDLPSPDRKVPWGCRYHPSLAHHRAKAESLLQVFT